jgi:hypothetical protein
MDHLIIPATKSTPAVDFDAGANRLQIKGESYPENAAKFYEALFDWLAGYGGQLAPRQRIVADLEIVYFNSSSSKALMNLFDWLEEMADAGHAVAVNWYYHPENQSAMECGEEFKEETKAIVFNLVALDG